MMSSYLDERTLARFMAKVPTRGPDECWTWTGGRYVSGYGAFVVFRRTRRAHRVAYEVFVGPVPDGHELDHTCHTRDETCRGRGVDCPHRACVNPTHLEPVTHLENVLRGDSFSAHEAKLTHCPQGHPYAGANLYIIPSTGGRMCKTCMRAHHKALMRGRREAEKDTRG